MANSDNIKNDAALVDVSQIKAINKVSFKQRMKAYKRKPLSLVLLILVGLAAALSAAHGWAWRFFATRPSTALSVSASPCSP